MFRPTGRVANLATVRVENMPRQKERDSSSLLNMKIQ
jgi:hypothetical protein